MTDQKTIQETQTAVRALLGWTEHQYAFYQYESGMAYLHAYYSNYEKPILRLSASRLFWNWWNGWWQDLDQVFLREMEGNDTTPHYRLLIYKGLHQPEILAAELTIPRVVYGPGTITVKMPATC